MAGAFTNVNLSQLPAPNVVEEVDFETILAEMLADLRARDAAFDALVEADPAYKVLEVAAYREMLIRVRVNEASRAGMLAFARSSDLDQIGANVNVSRLIVDAGNPSANPPIPPTYETDDDFRTRIQLSFEGYTTAGSEGSYVYHALSADGDVKDASAVSPAPGEITVYVLSRTGNGAPPAGLLSKVAAALNAEDVRPLTDTVEVVGPTITTFAIVAELTMYPGPDSNVVKQAALEAVQAYVKGVQRIGYDVTRSGIFRALHQPGVQNVALTSPAADIVIADGFAPYCNSITLSVAGAPDV